MLVYSEFFKNGKVNLILNLLIDYFGLYFVFLLMYGWFNGDGW